MSTQPAVIGGQLVETGQTLEVWDPSTGKVLDRTTRGTGVEIEEAVKAARDASEAWRHTPTGERSIILRRVSELVRSEAEALALLESQDTGKPLGQARADVSVAARYFEYYANTVEAFFGATLPANRDLRVYISNEPFGVTGHIIPWNYPLQIGCRTIAPAIATGNCVIVKPAEEAPLTVIRLAQIALKAGLPAGVLNVVPGLGVEAGDALARNPGIDHLSFTGSMVTGIAVAKAAAENVIPTSLELGGKSPNIVFPDADLDRALPVIAKSILQNAGQTCSAGSRLLIHSVVHDEVLERLRILFSKIRMGAGPSDPDLGPLISAQQLARVAGMVERAAHAGATRIIGHGSPDAPVVPAEGYYYAPTILANVDPSLEIAREEVFGPVVAVSAFHTTDEAIALANGTPYGLTAAVWTRGLDIAHLVAEEIRAGQVYINTYGAGGGVEYPFGGFKKSGYGREKGFAALSAFCQAKTVILRVTT